MAFETGNKYWHFRNKHGRNYKYQPEELWDEFVQYMEWLEKETLKEQKQFPYQGKVVVHDAPKMRAPTLQGFCAFADIEMKTFENYDKNADFLHITARIRNILFSSKFEGAAAGLLDSNLIARELGIADNQNVNLPTGMIIEVQDEETKALLEEIRKALNDIDEGNEGIQGESQSL